MDWTSIITLTISACIGPVAVVYVLAAQGLNIHYGYSGLWNFGQAGFMAVGAYSVAVISQPASLGGLDWPLWVGVIVALLSSFVLSLIMGIPTLRLRGDYLAIVTIATSEIIRLVLRSEATEAFSGGNSGVNGFAASLYEANPFNNGKRYEFGPFSYLGKELWLMVIGWFVVGAFALLTFLLMRSPWGRVLRSIRENEDAVRSLGKNVQWYKLQALVLGGVMGAAGGVMLALQQNLALPDDFVTRTTFIAYAALILGGAARVLGPIVGGILWYGMFALVLNVVQQAKNAGYFPKSVENNATVLSFVFLGLALMLLVVFRPQGIFGSRREVELDAR